MRIKSFLFQSFAQIFFPVFLVLFFIASVVIFIRIAGVTFVVQISFLELLSLYFYTLPTMLFFVVPLSFFVACVLGLSRLSFDYELPVLFALGMHPKKILQVFFPITLLTTLSMFIIALILTPLSDIAYRQFLQERKNSININLQAGEFGQKLGDWLVYVQKDKDRINAYENIVLLSLDKEKGGLIFAKDAKIQNQQGIMEAVLSQGKIYRKKETDIEQVFFDTLTLRDSVNLDTGQHLGVLAYWERAFYPNERQKKTMLNLNMYVLLSLFPLISLFYFPVLGIKNPRYQKNYTILQTIGTIGIFLALMYLGASYIPFITMVLLPLLWSGIGYYLYRHFIVRFY